MPLRPEAEPVEQHEACLSFFFSQIIHGYPSGMIREKKQLWAFQNAHEVLYLYSQ
jgi:hypothetical protein